MREFGREITNDNMQPFVSSGSTKNVIMMVPIPIENKVSLNA